MISIKNGTIIWFTGLSSAGKTTLAKILHKHINTPVVLLDGDVARRYVSPDLTYSQRDRFKQMDRLYGIIRLLSEGGISSIVCTISSPTKRMDSIFIIYVKCSLEKCRERDVKRLYEKYDKGEIRDIMGIDLEYIPPDNPFLILETDKYTTDECIDRLIRKLEGERII